MPFNTRVRVTNPDNGKSVTVRILAAPPAVSRIRALRALSACSWLPVTIAAAIW
ncbi:hypothetical protein JNW89_33120, partial [Micromonospora sp. 4G55]|nr:hypothetical protein [Micromonospora sp. 4G55]